MEEFLNRTYTTESPEALAALRERGFANVNVESGTLTIENSVLSKGIHNIFTLREGATLRSEDKANFITMNTKIECEPKSQLEFRNVVFQSEDIKISSNNNIKNTMVLYGKNQTDLSYSDSKIGAILGIKSGMINLRNSHIDTPYVILKSDKVDATNCHGNIKIMFIDSQEISIDKAWPEASKICIGTNSKIISNEPVQNDQRLILLDPALFSKFSEQILNIITPISGEDASFLEDSVQYHFQLN